MDSPTFYTPKRVVHQNTDSYVIAEIENNHQGCVDTCIEMFVAAKLPALMPSSCKSEIIATCTHMQRTPHTITARTHLEIPTVHRDYLEFDEAQYIDLFAAADEIGITLFATAFDLSSADFWKSSAVQCTR